MKSKEEFVQRWRNHVAGMALYGCCSDQPDSSALARATRAMQIPAEVERLLASMYDDLTREARPSNGHSSQEIDKPKEIKQ